MSGQLMIERYFLKYLEPRNPSMFACWNMTSAFHQTADNLSWRWHFISCSCIPSRPTRGERAWGLASSFWAWTQLWLSMWLSKFSGVYWRLLKSLWPFHAPAFLLSFFWLVCLPLLLYTGSDSHGVKLLALMFII